MAKLDVGFEEIVRTKAMAGLTVRGRLELGDVTYLRRTMHHPRSDDELLMSFGEKFNPYRDCPFPPRRHRVKKAPRSTARRQIGRSTRSDWKMTGDFISREAAQR